MQEQQREIGRKKSVTMRVVTMLVPVMLVLVLLSQTAFAQNTYVITDGERVVIHTSSATDPAKILNEAGLSLGEDDTYSTSPGFGVSEITVQRAGSGPEPISPEGVVHSTQTYTVSIPSETKLMKDATLPAGTQKVITPGVDGQLRCTARVEYHDGVEVGRIVLKQTVIQQPVDELVAVGTGPQTDLEAGNTVIGDGYIVLPTGEILTYSHTMDVVATAYTHTNPGCDMYTATLTEVRVGTVAVDPRVIPYGTRMFIVTKDGAYIYGVSTAEDCGGAIKNKRVDLYYPTQYECTQFGRRDATIYFLTSGE